MADIFLDFETYNELSIAKTSARRYAEHPSLEILCMAWAVGDKPVQIWIPGRNSPPPWTKRPGTHTFHAHNAPFERAVWVHHCVPRLEWVLPPLESWSCTAAQCAAMGLPRALDKAAKALGHEGKDDAGRKAMLRAIKPNKEGHKERHPDLLSMVYDYCKNDVEVERWLYTMTPTLWDKEAANFYCSERINERGIPLDMPAIDAAIDMLEQYNQRQLERLREITGDSEITGNMAARLIKWLEPHGVELDNLQAGTVTAELEKDDTPPEAREVLELRQVLSKASNAKLKAMEARSSDGRVHGAHIFHSAHTGRYGGKGVQFQNVPRGFATDEENEEAIQAISTRDPEWVGLLYGDVSTTVSKTLRSMVCAPEGKHLIVVDFAAIEARVLAWLANCSKLLNLFETGGDPYVDMAARVYDVGMEDVTPAQRFLGKTCILGLGYGMGAKTFRTTCENWGVEDVDQDFAERAVGVYRDIYPEIPGLWKRMQHGAMHVLNNPGVMSLGKIVYSIIGEDEQPNHWLQMMLPSGRKISYHRPFIGEKPAPWDKDTLIPTIGYWGEDSQTYQYKRQHTYGGKLVENAVQGIARDLLVSAMRNLERKGHDVIFHVHDEVVVESADATVEEIERIVCTVPRWAAGCPVGAEGFKARRYRK